MKKLRCTRKHKKTSHLQYYHLWHTKDDGTEIYKCKQCHIEDEKEADRLNRIIENERKQREEYWENHSKKMEIRDKERERSKQENLWDCVVKKELAKGIKLKGLEKYKYLEAIPKELLRLKRASMKLDRLLKNKRAEEKEKIEQSIKPLVVCRYHGELLLKEVIRSGIIKQTGERQYKCRECMSKYHKSHYEKNKSKVLEKHAEYRKNNPEKIKQIWANYKGKRNGKNNKHDNASREDIANI